MSNTRQRQRKRWHPEDIKAAIRKRGFSLTGLARARALYPSAIRVAFSRPYPRAEQVVAELIGVPAKELWPDRYEIDGRPRRGFFAQVVKGGDAQ